MEVDCLACGEKVPVPEGEPGEKVGVGCPHCGLRFQVVLPANIGAETVFQPRTLGEELADEPPSSQGEADYTGRVGTGTVLLSPDDSLSAKPALETSIRGYLQRVGAEPGEDRLALAGDRIAVGREGADIVLDDPALSSRHFEIEARGGEFFIRDLDSSNGTFVNGNRIRATQLAPGDKVKAGQTQLVFRTEKVVRWDPSA